MKLTYFSLILFSVVGIFLSDSSAAPAMSAGTIALKNAGRILSTSLASDEILLELFTDKSAPKGSIQRLLALSPLADDSKYSNISSLSKKVPARFNGELESLLKLSPDLMILASFNRPELLQLLQNRKISQITLDRFNSLADIRSNIEQLTALCDCPQASTKMLQKFDRILQQAALATTARPRPTAVFLFADGTTFGKGTLVNDIIEKSGFENIMALEKSGGWFTVSQESLLAKQPAYIIAIGNNNEEALTAFKKNPLMTKLDAIRQKRVLVLPERLLFSTSHYAAEALDRLLKQKNELDATAKI